MSSIQTQVGFLKFNYEFSTARMTLWDDGVGYISGVYSRVRGKGHATQVFMDMCDYADRNVLILQLDVSAYGPNTQGKLTDEQLMGFYEKFGFIVIEDEGDPIRMERLPNQHF